MKLPLFESVVFFAWIFYGNRKWNWKVYYKIIPEHTMFCQDMRSFYTCAIMIIK